MEIVNTLDIDGTQWEMQDAEARNKIAILTESLIAQDLGDINIKLKPDYTADNINMTYHYKVGNIHFVQVAIDNISGGTIGTVQSNAIASINILPKKRTSFILLDYENNVPLRCFLNSNGDVNLGESTGVTQGKNHCLGELIFAEA